MPTITTAEVIVSNIGAVYSGPILAKAQAYFSDYKEQSIAGHGRAAGESVTLLINGEIQEEYRGENQRSDND